MSSLRRSKPNHRASPHLTMMQSNASPKPPQYSVYLCRARRNPRILFLAIGPHIIIARRPPKDRLDKIDTKKPKQINKRSDKSNHLRKRDDVNRSALTNLLSPPEVHQREVKCKEEGVGCSLRRDGDNSAS